MRTIEAGAGVSTILFAVKGARASRPTVAPRTGGGTGGSMLFTIAFVLLAAWLLGLLGVYEAGDLFHGLLLAGLMLLLLAFLRAREAALRRPAGGPPRRE